MTQNVFSAKGVHLHSDLTMTAALRTLRELAGERGSLTVGNGRINAYSQEFEYGRDNSANLVAYAVAAK
jgi:hypothetical protein